MVCKEQLPSICGKSKILFEKVYSVGRKTRKRKGKKKSTKKNKRERKELYRWGGKRQDFVRKPERDRERDNEGEVGLEKSFAEMQRDCDCRFSLVSRESR